MKATNKFNFFVPLDLEKGTDKKGRSLVKVKGIASSETEDSDGETLIPAGFDFEPLLKTGFLNWNHQAGKTAKAICGEPTAAKIINNGKDFYIEGFLYPNDQGKEVAELAETLETFSPNRRLGFSIEGQAQQRGCGPEFLDENKTIRNPEYDPVLWKKVTKAKITGVAITQSPKNPNTLMSIVKGNVDSFYVEDEEIEKEEKEGTAEKAMDTVAIGPTMPESVEHKTKPIVGAFLKKSDIYSLIYEKYTDDVEKADKIFSFINQINTNLFKMEKQISAEVIKKSFDILDDLIKAEEVETTKTTTLEEDVLQKEEDEVEEEEDEVEEEEDEDEDNEEVKEEMIKGLISSGMSKEKIVKSLTSLGVDKELVEDIYEGCIEEASKLKNNGGEVEKQSLVKGIEDLSINVSTKFSALGTLLKSFAEEREDLRETIDSLQKGHSILSEELEKIASLPNSPKSITTKRHIERFEKSEDSEEFSENIYSISDRQDMSRLADRLMAEVEIVKSKGNEAPDLEKAVMDLEISKSFDYKSLTPKLIAMGIKLKQ